MSIAKSAISPAFYGHAFEALVHQVFTKLEMTVTIHTRSVALPQDTVGGYDDEFTLMPDIIKECVGTNLAEAMKHLRSRKMDLIKSSYWHPDFPTVPAFDSILCMPARKTVLYINLTVAKEKSVHMTTRTGLHEAVKQSLQSSLELSGGSINDWTFRYVAIEPSSQEADALKVEAKEGSFSVGDIAMGKGYVTYVK
jgi:hypothetical protein